MSSHRCISSTKKSAIKGHQWLGKSALRKLLRGIFQANIWILHPIERKQSVRCGCISIWTIVEGLERTYKEITWNNIVERFFFHLQPSVKQLWCQLTALPHTGQAVESTLCNYVTATLEAKCHNHFVLRTTRKADNGLGNGDLNRLL